MKWKSLAKSELILRAVLTWVIFSWRFFELLCTHDVSGPDACIK